MRMFGKIKEVLMLALTFMTLAAFAGCTGDNNTTSLTNPNPNPFTPTGTVTGVLRDTSTNQPISGATVAILDKKTVTDLQGQFTIANVPANTAVGAESTAGAASDTYTVTIDMGAVNAKSATPVYPSFAYSTVKVVYTSLGETSGQTATTTSTTNHDTPVNGFVASITPFVGKLSSTVVVQVVDKNNAPQAGASVQLFSTGKTATAFDTTTTVANPGNLVASKTTDASGLVTFANVEALRVFTAVANASGANGSLTGTMTVAAPADGLTASYLNNQDVFTLATGLAGADGKNDALQVVASDTVAPLVVGSSPANLGNLEAGSNTSVTFSFSKDINQNSAYAKALTASAAAAGGLFKDVYVNYNGPKAGNIPAYTLTWTDARTLTVTFTTQAASLYTVAILKPVSGKGLTDAAGNEIPYTGATFNGVVSAYAVTFSTNGNITLVAPAPAVDAVIPTTINWLAVPGASSYNIYVTPNNGTTSVKNVAGSVNSWDLVTDGGFAFTPSTQYSVQVAAVSNSGPVGPLGPTTALTFTPATLTQPTLTASSSPSTPYGVQWTPIANAKSYNVYIAQVVNGVVNASGTVVLGATATTFDVTAQAGLVYAGFGTSTVPVTYSVRVAAVNPQNVVGAKSAPFTVSNINATTPTVTVDSINQYKLTWPALPNVTGYVAHVTTLLNGVATGSADSPIPVVANQATYSFTSPTAFMNGAQSYSVKIGALSNQGIEGTDSAAFLFSDAGLGAPTVTVNAVSSSIIQWNNVPKAASYNVYVVKTDGTGTKSSSVTNVVASVNGGSFNITGAPIYSGYGTDASTSYSAQVSTVDANNVETQASGWSTAVNFSSATPAQVDATTLVRLGVPGSLNYTWTAVPQASYYQVELQRTDNGVAQGWTDVTLLTQTTGVQSVPASLSVSGVANTSGATGNYLVFNSNNFQFLTLTARTYAFRIRAINANLVAGPWSDSTVAAAQITELATQNGISISSVNLTPTTSFTGTTYPNSNGYLTDPVWDASTEPASNFLLGSNANAALSVIDTTTPAWTANSAKVYGMKVTFNGPMKESDVENLGNWQVSKVSNTTPPAGGGFADNATSSLDVIPTITKVIFDVNNQTALVYFTVTQNATNNATSDPKHVMFQYRGVDANGNPMSNPFSFDGAVNGTFTLPSTYTPHP